MAAVIIVSRTSVLPVEWDNYCQLNLFLQALIGEEAPRFDFYLRAHRLAVSLLQPSNWKIIGLTPSLVQYFLVSSDTILKNHISTVYELILKREKDELKVVI